MFRRCPSCGGLFQAKVIEREQLGNPYTIQVQLTQGHYKTERVENFRIHYRCKSCGHEWTNVCEQILHDHLKL